MVVDYLIFCCVLFNGGEVGGVCLIGFKILVLMMSNYIFGGCVLLEVLCLMFVEVVYNGIGFGFGFVVMMCFVEMLIVGSFGEYNWGGVVMILFWIDLVEELIVIFMM